jgi:hypothetical protein
MGALPDGRGAQELILETHLDHVKDLSRIEPGLRGTDRTYAGTGPAVEALLDLLTPRYGGYFPLELRLKLAVRQWQNGDLPDWAVRARGFLNINLMLLP